MTLVGHAKPCSLAYISFSFCRLIDSAHSRVLPYAYWSVEAGSSLRPVVFTYMYNTRNDYIS